MQSTGAKGLYLLVICLLTFWTDTKHAPTTAAVATIAAAAAAAASANRSRHNSSSSSSNSSGAQSCSGKTLVVYVCARAVPAHEERA
jgi:hypothetical protein